MRKCGKTIMIIFIRKSYNHEFNLIFSLILAFMLLTASIIVLTVVPNIEKFTDYGTVVAIYENPYKTKTDTITHTVEVAFPDDANTQIVGNQKSIKKYKLGQKVPITKERDINNFIFILSIFGTMGGILWIIPIGVNFLEYLFKSYKIEIISKKEYILRKELDPFGEEDWSS